MTCEETELELSGGEVSPVAKAHLASCIDCQKTARVLGLAALPELNDTERLMLSSLPVTIQREWRPAKPARFHFVKQSLGYALAAGIGALIASAVILKLRPVDPPVVQVKEISAVSDSNLSDDEVFFDVGWPSPTEGDL